MTEERTPVGADSDQQGIPVVTDSPQIGTPEVADPNHPEAGQPETAGAPTPGGQDTSDGDSRYKNLQAKMTKLAQENARLKQSMTPEVVAAMQSGQMPTGKDLLKKQFEAHPELIDDPVSQAQYFSNMSQAQTAQMLAEWDAKREFADEAKKLVPDLNVRELEPLYWKVRREYQTAGIDENPWLGAFAVANPRAALKVGREKEKTAMDDVSKRAALRQEKPGVAKEPPVVKKEQTVSVSDFFRTSAAKHLEALAKRRGEQ